MFGNDKFLFNVSTNYHICVSDKKIKIGCQLKTIAKWRSVTERDGVAMDGKRGGRFAKEFLPKLLKMYDSFIG